MKRLIFIFWLFIGLTSFVLVADFPAAEIKNESIKAKLYLPDAQRGYYQGTRFDWSGVIPSLEFQGHQYFGQWFEKYDPKVHESVMGPTEEFMVVGYDEAKPGDTFLKIGVGSLRKLDAAQYFFAKYYDIVDPGKRTVKTKSDRVEFTHELKDAAGYSYIYRKVVRLVKGKPQLVLEHSLRNTGQKAIATSVYNHNFFTIDNEPTGPGIEVKFPFNVQPAGSTRGFGDMVLADDSKITYTRQLNKGEQVFSSSLEGFGTSARDYDFRIENRKTGAGVRITSDQAIQKIVYWACSTTSCPEPYIAINVAPGQEVKWQINYDFYTFPKTAATR
ncbi:hypothetical protein AHMF7605_06375 [Adhaeribacter arboris]|uniref:Uncharacterized protein n=1 Tax=Adhaeribacter arboris TaxID=2072846 RepID=A0A2T2YCC7_9BACT|nr:hypothetical protein [Adhaeribacter arboris]PSR53181.1 hypothetical protein AHMF7605_06375 [Adhaeribacter arboris]